MRLTAAWAILAVTPALSAAAQPGSAMTDPPPPAREAEAARPPLRPGDPAPALSVDSWFKGEPVTGFEPGQVYVIEFWATWCGPCIEAIPHLTHLQKHYGSKVRLIGVSTDQNRDQADRFVIDQGEGMGYTVGHDADRSMTDDWMRPAGRNGIPCSFIVDGRGRLAWVGHPRFGLDHVLERVARGDFDPAAWAAAEAGFFQATQRAVAAARASDFAGAWAALDEAAKADPYFVAQAQMTRFRIVINIKQDHAEAAKLAAAMIDGTHKDDASALIMIASELQTAPGPVNRDTSLAIRALERAVELESGKEAATLAALAQAHWRGKNADRAIEAQERAVAAARGEAQKARMQETLTQYKQGK